MGVLKFLFSLHVSAENICVVLGKLLAPCDLVCTLTCLNRGFVCQGLERGDLQASKG